MGYTRTPPSSALCSDSNPHKDTLSKPLPFHFLSPCAVGALKSVSFSVFFFLLCFFPHLTQMWVFLPLLFHNAFCSPFLLTCVRLGSLDIFQCVFVQRNQDAVS